MDILAHTFSISRFVFYLICICSSSPNLCDRPSGAAGENIQRNIASFKNQFRSVVTCEKKGRQQRNIMGKFETKNISLFFEFLIVIGKENMTKKICFQLTTALRQHSLFLVIILNPVWCQPYGQIWN